MIRKALVLIFALSGAGVASAQEGAVVTLGFGAALAPEYFGSDDYGVGPTGSFSMEYLKLGRLRFGSPEPGTGASGFSLGGSFRIVGAREAADHPELAGMQDIDTAVEIGLGVNYATPGFRAFGKLRYGVIGHESLVGEIGADAVVRPNDRLTLTAGPRLQIGSDRFAATYFGVTAAEAVASGLPAFAAEGGLLGAGVEIGFNYALDDDWGLRGRVGYSRLMGDAGDSPITGLGSRTQAGASLMLTRRISLGF